MPRVISGSAGGLVLLAPDGKGTRPTSDRVKEALFSILAPRLADARVLDLYAGTGQLAIEALSRGAASAVFVDSDRAAVTLIRRNLERTRLADRATVLPTTVASALGRLGREGAPFDLVLLDPPYAQAIAAFRAAATLLLSETLLSPDALLVLEHDAKNAAEARVINLQRVRSCKYGNTMLTFYSGLPYGNPQEDVLGTD
jgi:16S rRNA (guanine966-N2)-methyltransferase